MTNGEGTKGGGEDQWNDFLCHCVWPPRLTWKVWGQWRTGGIEIKAVQPLVESLSESEGCPASKGQFFGNIRTIQCCNLHTQKRIILLILVL